MRSQYRRVIEVQAQNFGLDPDLLEAQVLVESDDNPWAFRWEPAFWGTYLQGQAAAVWGPLGACSYGLLQILGQVALERDFHGSPHELFAPATNLFLGAKHLAWLRKQVDGDLEAAIAAYNGGLGGNQRPPFRNQPYLTRVLTRRDGFVSGGRQP